MNKNKGVQHGQIWWLFAGFRIGLEKPLERLFWPNCPFETELR